MTLDSLDNQVIWHLDNDARLPLSELARRVGVSKQVLNYRLNKLLKDEVLRGFISMVDIHRLGFLTYRIYFRYHSVTREEEKSILDYLVTHDYTLWVVSTAGIWDVEAVFTARNFVHFNNILKKLKHDLGKFISKYNISMSIVSYHLKRDYLIEKERSEFQASYYGFEPQPGKWDKLDLSLLSELSRNCRQTNEALGRKLGVTYQTIKQRIKRLEEGGILQCHRILLDLEKVNRQYHKVMLTLPPMSSQEEEKLYQFCASHNFVVYLTEVLGDWQLEIETEVQNRDEITEFLRELRIRFPTLVKDYEILQVTKEHKMNYFPMGEKFLSDQGTAPLSVSNKSLKRKKK